MTTLRLVTIRAVLYRAVEHTEENTVPIPIRSFLDCDELCSSLTVEDV